MGLFHEPAVGIGGMVGLALLVGSIRAASWLRRMHALHPGTLSVLLVSGLALGTFWVSGLQLLLGVLGALIAQGVGVIVWVGGGWTIRARDQRTLIEAWSVVWGVLLGLLLCLSMGQPFDEAEIREDFVLGLFVSLLAPWLEKALRVSRG